MGPPVTRLWSEGDDQANPHLWTTDGPGVMVPRPTEEVSSRIGLSVKCAPDEHWSETGSSHTVVSDGIYRMPKHLKEIVYVQLQPAGGLPLWEGRG